MLRIITVVVTVHSLTLAPRNELQSYSVETLQITFTIIISSTIALAFATGIFDDNDMTAFWLVAVTHPVKSISRTTSRIFADIVE